MCFVIQELFERIHVFDLSKERITGFRIKPEKHQRFVLGQLQQQWLIQLKNVIGKNKYQTK